MEDFSAKPVIPRFPVLAAIYGTTLIFLLSTVLISVYFDVPPSFFSRDPTASLNGHPLTGIQSNLGVLLWCATGSVCIFSYMILRRRRIDGTCSGFFLWSGAFTLVLTLDDLFQLHEDLLYRYLGSWIYEKILFIIYVFFLIWFVIRFRRIILRSEYILLLLAFLFFAASLVVDHYGHVWMSPWRIFYEDGLKLLGIATWGCFLTRRCFQEMERQFSAD